MTKKKLFKYSAAVFVLIITCALILCYCKKNYKGSNISNYAISAEYNEEKNTISGHETINWINKTNKKLDSVKIHLYGIAFSKRAKNQAIRKEDVAEAYPNGLSYGDITIENIKVYDKKANFSYEGDDQDILSINQKVGNEETLKIDFDFLLILANVHSRLGYNEKTINLGNWFPIVAGFDNGFVTNPYYDIGDPFFSEIADFKINMTTPMDMKIASSGVYKQSCTKDSKSLYQISAKNVRDLAIVMSKNFNVISKKYNDIDINYFYYNDQKAQESLATAEDAIRTFSEKFCKYPYKQISVVQTKLVQGGMEYPNIVMISDKATDDKYKEIIIHEIAHQWWYGIVGNDQTHDAWLDEGLADYSTTLFYKWNPNYKITYDSRVATAVKRYVSYVENIKPNTAMNKRLNEYRTSSEYAIMNYIKGEIMFDTLLKTLGEDQFLKGLQLYVKENMFKISNKDKLINAFNKVSKFRVDNFFQSWILGQSKIK